MIVELKAGYPGFGEMAAICYVRTGRRPGKRTIERVLSEEPVPLRTLRRFERYHEIPRSIEAGGPCSPCTPRGGPSRR